jgi:opacity protein-like surface antigen
VTKHATLRKLAAIAVLAAACLLTSALPARAQTPYYFGAQILGHNISGLSESRVGYGFRGGYDAYLPFISLEGEVNFFPTTSGGNLGETQALFGLKFGKHIGRWGGFVKARPGFTHFGGGAFPTRLTERTKFALDLGGGLEYDLAPKIGLRWDLGDTKIYYGNAALLPSPAGTPGPRLGTHDSFQTSLGLVVRF